MNPPFRKSRSPFQLLLVFLFQTKLRIKLCHLIMGIGKLYLEQICPVICDYRLLNLSPGLIAGSKKQQQPWLLRIILKSYGDQLLRLFIPLCKEIEIGHPSEGVKFQRIALQDMGKPLFCPFILTSEQTYSAVQIKRLEIRRTLFLKGLQLFQSPLGIPLEIKILGNAEGLIIPAVPSIAARDQKDCKQKDFYELHA